MANNIGGFCCNFSYGAYLAAGAVRPLICEDNDCAQEIARTAVTLLVSNLVVQTLKRIVPERRPDTGQRGSFPSGHSANTLAVATISSLHHPEQAAGWFGPALAICGARIALRRHRLRDVVIGGLMGYVIARAVAAKMGG